MLTLPQSSEYIEIIEKLKLFTTVEEFINFAFHCFNMSDILEDSIYEHAYLFTAKKIYKIYTNKNY